MAKLVSFETALLAKKMGFDEYTSIKYNPDGVDVLHDSGDNIFAPDQDHLQDWLERHNMYISIAPEMYTQGINWNWQVLWYLPEDQWRWREYEDDGDQQKYPEHICSGTGWYGDNHEHPTRYNALEAALTMALKKLDILFRHNSVEGLCKLYGVDNTTFINMIRPFSTELGDWAFREFTEKQLAIIVSHLGQPPQ